MKPRNIKALNETFSLASYILIETKSPLTSSNLEESSYSQFDNTYRYSLSTLTLPTKEPIIITVGYFMVSLLTEEEISELSTKEYIHINTKKLRSRIKFFLHSTVKGLFGTAENGKLLELEPEFLLFPKDIAQSFAEIFKFKTKDPMGFPNLSLDHPLNDLPSSYPMNFCLLTLRPTSLEAFASIPKEPKLFNISDRPFEGQKVFMISSPFALMSSKFYKNTVNVAHVSKVAFRTSRKLFGGLKRGYIFLVNNAIKEGEEGAPVFNEHFEVIGLILASISPYKNDSVGFNVCISTLPIMDLLDKISSYLNIQNIWKLTVAPFRPFAKALPIKSVLSRVVKVITSCNVGSGILMNAKGYILTNRHVLKGNTNKDFTIEISYDGQIESEYYSAEVFRESNGELDIALLKVTKDLSERTLKVIKSTKRFLDHPIDVRYLQGSEVYAVGYTFSELNIIDFKVMATKGFLSKVVIYQNMPFLILTSCPVYNGFSGGAIVSNRGEFLGLITYNFTHSTKGILNDLNFSYCHSIFKELLDSMDEKDEQKVKDLDIWHIEDKYIEKMALSQTVEYVPRFEIESKL